MADRLFSSFGQDILDALYWTATEPKSRKRSHIGVIPHFIMAVFYVCILLMCKGSAMLGGGRRFVGNRVHCVMLLMLHWK